MLPSKGYFKSFHCPFYDNGRCKRPYCHFRHLRRERPSHVESSMIANGGTSSLEPADSGLLDQLPHDNGHNVQSKNGRHVLSKDVSKQSTSTEAIYKPSTSVLSYKPTPISELRKRHIPVTFNQDTERRSHDSNLRKKKKIEYVPKPLNGNVYVVDYKPTPSNLSSKSSLLNAYTPSSIDVSDSLTQSESDKLDLLIKNPHLTPMSLGITKKPVSFRQEIPDDFDLDDISTEMDMLGQILDDEMQDESNSPKSDLDTKCENEDDTGNVVEQISDLNSGDDHKKEVKFHKTDELGNLKNCTNTITETVGSSLVKLSSDETSDHIVKRGDNEEIPKKETKDESGDSMKHKHHPISKSKHKTSSSHRTDEDTKHSSKSKSEKNSDSHKKSSEKHSSSKKDHNHSESHKKTSEKKSELVSSSSSKPRDKSSETRHHSKHVSSSSKSSETPQKPLSSSDKHSHRSSKSSSSRDEKSRSHTDSNSKKESSNKKHSHSSRSEKHTENNNESGSKNKEETSSHRKRKHSTDEKHHSSSKHSKTSNHDSSKSSKSSSQRKRSSKDDDVSKHKRRRESRDSRRRSCSGSKQSDSDHSSDVEEVTKPFETIVIETSDDSSDNEGNVFSRGSDVPESDMDDHMDDDDSCPESEPVHPAVNLPQRDIMIPEVKSKTRIAHNPEVNGRSFLKTSTAKKLISPSEALLDRYHKSQETATSDSNMTAYQGQKIRIAHVPNVSSLLNAKQRIMSKPEISNRNKTQVSGIPSTSTQSSKSKDSFPVVASVENCSIPLIKRQVYLNKVYDLYSRIYNTDVAKIKAITAEKELSINCKTIVTYLNKIAQLCISLKKEMMIVTGSAPPVEAAQPEDPLIPEYTNGKPLYDCCLDLKLEDLYENGIPVEHPTIPNAARMKNLFRKPESFNKSISTCINCGQNFSVDEHNFSIERKCKYHFGKPRKKRDRAQWDSTWTCCNKSKPCYVSEYHIRDTTNYEAMMGFVKTPPCPRDVKFPGIFAVDCEMCYTTENCELTRVTVINHERRVIYESFCLPDAPIIDYCTRFSGVQESDLRGVTTRLSDIQKDLMKIFNEKSILVGHGIGNDLKALKIIHTNIVDTCQVFPHKHGGTFKRKLRDVAMEFLRREIQTGDAGHCSEEDALAALDLMIYRIKENRKSFKSRTIISLDDKSKVK